MPHSNDLNAIGTVTAPVEIYAGGDETAPAGGYVITATGTVANTILIEGGGYILTAGLQAAGSTNDAVIKIVGGDYITLQNFIINGSSRSYHFGHASFHHTLRLFRVFQLVADSDPVTGFY